MGKNSPEHIKNIISHILAGREFNSTGGQNKILSAWAETVGKKILAHTKLHNIKKNKLVVTVDSSSWLYQLNLEKGKISKKLNKILENNEPLKIYFRLGEV